ncbi:MAG TPA: response regulator transcription factor, partial [Bacillota bacterium]
MAPANVLVVDDEERMRRLLRLYLENEGYSVVEASNGTEALQRFREGPFDLVVLDLMLPQTDGWAVCRSIRRAGDVPLIILTALGSESERLLGFDLGADDYVTKPFSPKELVSRAKALLRRANRARELPPSISHGPLVIEPHSRTVRYGSKDLPLAPKEFDLLQLLAAHPRQVFTRDQLLNDVWGYD